MIPINTANKYLESTTTSFPSVSIGKLHLIQLTYSPDHQLGKHFEEQN